MRWKRRFNRGFNQREMGIPQKAISEGFESIQLVSWSPLPVQKGFYALSPKLNWEGLKEFWSEGYIGGRAKFRTFLLLFLLSSSRQPCQPHLFLLKIRQHSITFIIRGRKFLVSDTKWSSSGPGPSSSKFPEPKGFYDVRPSRKNRNFQIIRISRLSWISPPFLRKRWAIFNK